jgi:hypothetical protein
MNSNPYFLNPEKVMIRKVCQTKRSVSRGSLTLSSKTKKKKLKSIPVMEKEVQTFFNKLIHLRDRFKIPGKEGYFFKCISCGEILPEEKANAGHFWPVRGFKWLRFDEDNVHLECQRDNGFNDAHLINYNWNLIDKIGVDRYWILSKKANEKTREFKGFTREKLLQLKEHYKNRAGTYKDHASATFVS